VVVAGASRADVGARTAPVGAAVEIRPSCCCGAGAGEAEEEDHRGALMMMMRGADRGGGGDDDVRSYSSYRTGAWGVTWGASRGDRPGDLVGIPSCGIDGEDREDIPPASSIHPHDAADPFLDDAGGDGIRGAGGLGARSHRCGGP
jgi:hypothetical protein